LPRSAALKQAHAQGFAPITKSSANRLFTFAGHDRGVSALNLPLTHTHYPATFIERGVAVPFTTPMLAGARVRLGHDRSAEFVLPNPSGGRGVYIVTWSGVRQYCRPTVHDSLLQERIAGSPVLSPSTIRLAARQIATEGYAGQSAARAAEVAEAHEQAAIEDAKRLVLSALIQQNLPGQAQATGTRLSDAALEQHGKPTIRQASTRLGCPPATIGRGLTALARTFAAVGTSAEPDTSRAADVQRRMARLRRSVATWAAVGDAASGLARDIASAIQLTLSCAAAVTPNTRALCADMMLLLDAWLAAPADVQRQVERLDWLLDGWERICLLWETTDKISYRRAALFEMAQLVPVLPPEIQAWTGRALPAGALQPAWRVVSMDDGWRSGSAAFGLIARNERLRAMSG